MTTTSFTFSEHGRRPLTLFMLAVGLVFAASILVVEPDAPWLLWAPVVFYNAALLWMIIANPHHGMDIATDGITIFGPKTSQTVPVASIRAVFINEWSDNTDVRLELHDGTSVIVPGMAQPATPVLRTQLERFGYPTTGP